MFEKGDFVFYASSGICCVKDIQRAPLAGMPEDRVYYILQSVHEQNGITYFPTDCTSVFLRPILTKKEATSFLQNTDRVVPIVAEDAKALRAQYQEAMKEYQPNAWFRVLKTIRERSDRLAGTSRTQRLSETERSFGEEARKYLYTELSLALNLPDSQIEQLLFERESKKAE